MNSEVPPYRTLRLRRLLHVHSSIWHERVSSEFSAVAFGVLWCLATHGATAQRDMLSLAQIDKSSLAELLKRLEDQGVLSSTRDPHDKRRKVLSLTEKGRRIHDELRGPADELNVLMTSGLTAEELKTLDGILNKLLMSEVVRSVE